MSTAVISHRLEFHSLADAALKAATRFWFGVAVIGQSIFFFAVASFYGITAARGNWQAWNKFMTHGFTPGKPLGNFVVSMHVFSAAIIILAGMLQLIPQIRNRFPVFHRWLGRVYVVTAFTLSGAGLYMLWFRGTVGNASQHLRFHAKRCAHHALRGDGDALCDASRFQNASPMGAAPVSRGQRLLVHSSCNFSGNFPQSRPIWFRSSYIYRPVSYVCFIRAISGAAGRPGTLSARAGTSRCGAPLCCRRPNFRADTRNGHRHRCGFHGRVDSRR